MGYMTANVTKTNTVVFYLLQAAHCFGTAKILIQERIKGIVKN